MLGVGHRASGPVQLRYPYNPRPSDGCGRGRARIYYVAHVYSSDLVSGWDWVGAVICLIPFVVVLMLKLTFT